jgi:hypothetical protein
LEASHFFLLRHSGLYQQAHKMFWLLDCFIRNTDENMIIIIVASIATIIFLEGA